MTSPRRAILTAAFAVLAVLAGPWVARADVGGAPARTHALLGASVVTSPGSEPFHATVILRDGRVEMVGVDADIPAGAVRHDLTGRTLYPGWVEPYLPLESAGQVPAGGAAHPNPRIHPEVRAVDDLPLDGAILRRLREAGFTVAQVVPPRGILRGTTAVVALADGDAGPHVLRADHAQAFAFERGSWTELSYPSSQMGTIALTRQTLLDARWNREAWAQWARSPGDVERPPESTAFRALIPLLDRAMPLLMLSPSQADLPRALALAGEFRLDAVVVSERPDHYRHVDQVAAALERARVRLIASLVFPDAPAWPDEDGRADIELDALLFWDRAPDDLAALEEAGVAFAVTSRGLDEPKDVLTRLRKAVRRGLSERAALAAVTTEPAAILGVLHRTGTIEPGKDANLLVATGNLFAPGTRIEAVWVEGERYGPEPRRAEKDDVAHQWALTLGSANTAAVVVELASDDELSGRVVPPGESSPGSDEEDEADKDDGGDDGTAGDSDEAEDQDVRDADDPLALTDVSLVRGRLAFRLPETASSAGNARFELELDGFFLRGRARLADGSTTPVLARRPRPAPRARSDAPISRSATAWPPEYDVRDAPGAILVRGATIWTCGPAGVLEGADLLIKGKRIAAVGVGLAAPGNALVIDGAGVHVTPGLIDCHSHSSISGGVNECTESCTAEVRVADVVNAESPAIYRELAGGLTVSNLLHGSCNAIGGQNAVIKLRWGAPARELLFAGAPGGIKFALGENVTRSGWDEKKSRDRYPNTRMGVEQLLRDRFHAAEDYRRSWDDWNLSHSGVAPRRDLELDALVEVLDGTRLVHCHSYRADEIVMFMRVAEDFGFRVATFQHVLEGYKVANELAAHGAGASAFSDWWSYKVEVIDAIPYNGEIMWRRGVNVSFNSDSSELSRRLNLEAAKAVKYGDVPEDEALMFVTRNPAIQLGIGDRVGSLEAGKDADFVIWSANPLSDFAVCRQTWIDGVKRFDRDEDLAARTVAAGLRERLLDKAERVPASEREKKAEKPKVEMERGVCVETSCCAGEAP